MEIAAGFAFSEQVFQTTFVQFGYPLAKKIRGVQRGGLACRLDQRFKAFHALRSTPETRAPLTQGFQ